MKRLLFLMYIGLLLPSRVLFCKCQDAQNTISVPLDKEASLYGYHVRVLLAEREDPMHEPWSVVTEQGYVLRDPDDSTYFLKSKDKKLCIAIRAGVIYCNGMIWNRNKVYIIPQQGHLVYEGKSYQGGFLVSIHNRVACLINNLEIEDYVYSVLKTESWPGWPLEVNKVFAIASRSYVIAMVMRSKSSKTPYHIRNTNVHQTYSGYHESPVLKQAVQETQGVFLSHNSKPIIAMFDICCGGIVPARLHTVDFSKAPYLKRNYACTFCKSTKRYSWQTVYTLQELRTLLAQEFPQAKHMTGISVAKKDKAGTIKKVTVHGRKKNFTLSGARLRVLCKKLKSTCFSITRSGDLFIFSGRGYGHHTGLCQWGAREMVRQGYEYREILEFYYPQTQFMRLR